MCTLFSIIKYSLNPSIAVPLVLCDSRALYWSEINKECFEGLDKVDAYIGGDNLYQLCYNLLQKKVAHLVQRTQDLA